MTESDKFPTAADDDWISPGRAALILRCNPKTVTRMADEGTIRSERRESGHRRVSRADVEALHAARLAADPMVPFALVASELARHLESHLSGSASMEDEAEAREVLAAFYALRASMVRQAAS